MRGRESFPPTKKVLLDAHSSAMQPFYTTLKTFLCLLLVLLGFPKNILAGADRSTFFAWEPC
jgi:hypothetical protein